MRAIRRAAARLKTWIDQFVHVDGRPEWTFVKLHTHGAPEKNASTLLGAPMEGLHAALAQLASHEPWRVHYVTAREMYNVARAAMDGMRGSPAGYFDYEVPPRAPQRARRRAERERTLPGRVCRSRRSRARGGRR